MKTVKREPKTNTEKYFDVIVLVILRGMTTDALRILAMPVSVIIALVIMCQDDIMSQYSSSYVVKIQTKQRLVKMLVPFHYTSKLVKTILR